MAAPLRDKSLIPHSLNEGPKRVGWRVRSRSQPTGATPTPCWVTAEMELDAAEGRWLRFKVGTGRRKEIIRSLARLEKKAVTSATGLRLGNRRVGWIFAIVTWW